MIETDQSLSPDWLPVLAKVARISGHELRNALNALVVNLDVVRTRVSDPGTQQFVAQSVAQSEESVRLAESAIALLDVLIGAIGREGELRCELVSPRQLQIKASPGQVERAARALGGLVDRKAIDVDTSDSTIILTIPDTPASPMGE